MRRGPMARSHGVNRVRSYLARRHERVTKHKQAKLKKSLSSYKREVSAYWQGEREAPPPKPRGLATG
jgi:hypothetical protein